MTENFKAYLSNLLNENIVTITAVHGGDISEAFAIETGSNRYFLKCHKGSEATEMYEVEAKGLKLISETQCIKTPKIFSVGTFDKKAFLLMEFVASKAANQKDSQALGRQLAELHLNSAELFGLDHDNRIGRLAQSNTQHQTWPVFYTQERLLPQLHLAQKKGLLQESDCPNPQLMESALEKLFTPMKPALLHGDLWSGNYLISETGTPYLIDPAVYYGDGLVDIAMSKLFGGFGHDFYSAYHEVISKPDAYEERIELYQLYYLLVHLNLFGASYRSGVLHILSRYF